MSGSDYVVIMAGGSGTRLWPLSRRNFPKQFLKIGSEVSLVQETARRLLPLVSWDRIFVVCGEDHASLMKKSFLELSPGQFLREPCGRNTAAAIALAAQTLLQKDPEARMAVLPADHKIPAEDLSLFQEVISTALRFCETQKGLLTLGVRPRIPATGYGYIRVGQVVQEGKHPVCRVSRFREKPDLTTAEGYLKSGDYFWNSGMFVWRAADYWEAYQKFLPEDASSLKGLPKDPSQSSWRETIEEIYPKLTSLSVDYAILEKSDSVFMIQAPFRWDDVGSLDSLHGYFSQDSQKNAASVPAVALDAQGNLLLSDEGIVACLGVENLVVIRNGNAVLVLPRERSEEVKSLLEEMKKKGYDQFL